MLFRQMTGWMIDCSRLTSPQPRAIRIDFWIVRVKLGNRQVIVIENIGAVNCVSIKTKLLVGANLPLPVIWDIAILSAIWRRSILIVMPPKLVPRPKF